MKEYSTKVEKYKLNGNFLGFIIRNALNQSESFFVFQQDYQFAE